jgi:hypothetical protein
MTDEPDETGSPGADAVRRLLAEARHTAPMPDDVATRMDAVLADLAGTPIGHDPSGAPVEVASLAAHRRRRAASLLVAAAAIVVGGVVVSQHLPHDGTPSTPAAAQDNAAPAQGDTGSQPLSPQRETPGPEKGADALRTHMSRGRVVVRPQHFSADALTGRALLDHRAPFFQSTGKTFPPCIARPPHSKLVQAVFRRAPAVLVYHHPAGSTQVVDLFVCGSAKPLKSITLPTD